MVRENAVVHVHTYMYVYVYISMYTLWPKCFTDDSFCVCPPSLPPLPLSAGTLVLLRAVSLWRWRRVRMSRGHGSTMASPETGPAQNRDRWVGIGTPQAI